MAKVKVTATTDTVTLIFSELSTVEYERDMIFTVGSKSSRTQTIAGGATPNSSYKFTVTGLDSGTTYDWELEVIKVSDGGPVYTNSGTITTEEEDRPTLFEWTYGKNKDGNFNLTASEWNRLTEKINEMREFLGISNYSFTKAVKGESFTATMYNEARKAIQGMGYDAGYYIPTVSKGDTITAYTMNILVSELNSAIKNL